MARERREKEKKKRRLALSPAVAITRGGADRRGEARGSRMSGVAAEEEEGRALPRLSSDAKKASGGLTMPLLCVLLRLWLLAWVRVHARERLGLFLVPLSSSVCEPEKKEEEERMKVPLSLSAA